MTTPKFNYYKNICDISIYILNHKRGHYFSHVFTFSLYCFDSQTKKSDLYNMYTYVHDL